MRGLDNLWVAMGFTCLAVSACAALEPRADPSRFFTLTRVVQLDQKRSHGGSDRGGINVGIGPINLPGYLDREQLVTRISENRFQIAAYDRWAEPLEENFTRVLLQNLTALAPTARIVRYPWRPSERPDYQLAIDVLRFEPDAAGSVEMIARWVARGVGAKQTPAEKETRLTVAVKGNTAEAAVAALSDALGELSQEIALALQGLEAKSQP